MMLTGCSASTVTPTWFALAGADALYADLSNAPVTEDVSDRP
jgi:hypothetical protein